MRSATPAIRLMQGDCIKKMKKLIAEGVKVDSVVCDPPYGISFLGNTWDHPDNIAFNPKVWKLCLKLLKPGGHLIAFSAARTYHRMAIAVEDAGFEIRDQLLWLHGQGMPLGNVDVAAHMAKANAGNPQGKANPNSPNHGAYVKKKTLKGAGGSNFTKSGTTQGKAEITDPEALEHLGEGTKLVPSHEPIVLARKPLKGTVVENIRKYGTGALNIDACRVELASEGEDNRLGGKGSWNANNTNSYSGGWSGATNVSSKKGRWPKNTLHDGSEGVLASFAYSGSPQAAKFMYCGKTTKADRDMGMEDFAAQAYIQFQTANGTSGKASSLSKGRDTEYRNTHPTVKPTALMRWLCKLVTPKGGTILDPFMGSGSTGRGAILEGYDFIGIDMQTEYVAISKARIMQALDERLKSEKTEAEMSALKTSFFGAPLRHPKGKPIRKRHRGKPIRRLAA